MWPFSKKQVINSTEYADLFKLITQLNAALAGLITKFEQLELKVNSLKGYVYKKNFNLPDIKEEKPQPKVEIPQNVAYDPFGVPDVRIVPKQNA